MVLYCNPDIVLSTVYSTVNFRDLFYLTAPPSSRKGLNELDFPRLHSLLPRRSASQVSIGIAWAFPGSRLWPVLCRCLSRGLIARQL